MDKPESKPAAERIPPYLLVAPDLSEDEITTLARIIVGKLPPNTPVRSSPRPNPN
jgi:hypothetical protein